MLTDSRFTLPVNPSIILFF